MNAKTVKIIKLVVSLAGIGTTLASKYFADKELDETIAKKVAEALAKEKGKES